MHMTNIEFSDQELSALIQLMDIAVKAQGLNVAEAAVVGYEHEIKGTVQLPEPETLVPYKDLTKTIVLKWLQDRINAMNAEDQRNPSTAEIENTIKVQLEEQIRPTTDKGKPWS